MNQYLAQILLAGFNFAPKGWALCWAQTMSIQQNQALFSILGTFYGGNGTQTFGLPDLRGRTAISQGQGPGLSNYTIGEPSGTPTVTLLGGSLPLHSHALNATTTAANSSSPSGNLIGQSPTADMIYGSPGNTTMSPTMINLNGGSQPLPIMQPYLCVNYIVALTGVFPSRN